MNTPEEDAAIFKAEVNKAVGNVWPASVRLDNGSTQHVRAFKAVAVSHTDDLFMVTGTFHDGREHSVVMERNIVMASVPAAARNAIQNIKAAFLQ